MIEINIIFAFSFILLGVVLSLASCIADFVESDIADKLMGTSLVLTFLGVSYAGVVLLVALARAIL